MPRSFLPPLPQLIDYTQRPRNARRQPGVQIPYEGSLVPKAGAAGFGTANDMSGVVTTESLAPRATGMMQDMPIQQPAESRPFAQKQPWFSNPWTEKFQEDVPWWQRGMKGAR